VKEYLRKLKAAERIANEIGNPFVQTFVTRMYIERLSGRAVRGELHISERGLRGRGKRWNKQRIWEALCGGSGMFKCK
jgi:hypothetical protein